MSASGPSLAQPADWDWGHSYDSGADELVRDLVVDHASNAVYAVGTYYAAGPFGLPAPAGGSEAFVAKFDMAGNLLWSRRIGGMSDELGYGVALAPDGRVFVVGGSRSSFWTISTSVAALSAVLGGVHAGNSDGFIVCLDPAGAALWSQKIGGANDDIAYSVAANATGVFVHGVLRGNSSFGTFSITVPSGYQQQVFLARFPLDGNSATWALTGGGSNDDLAERIAADENGTAVVGSFKGSTFVLESHPSGSTASSSISGTGDNGYVARITNSGAVAWARLINTNGTSGNAFNGIALGAGQAFITGRTSQGTRFPDLGAVNHPGAAEYAFIAAFDNTSGNGQWTRTLHSPESNGAEGFDLAVGANGMVYLAGSFMSSLSATDGTMLAGSGNHNLFIARFAPTGNRTWWRTDYSSGEGRGNAIGTSPAGHLFVGGRHRDELHLGSLIFPGGSSNNAFLGRLTDPIWSLSATAPARWKVLPAQCETGPVIDLNTRLRGHADAWEAAALVTSLDNALHAPDGLTATFNGGGSFMVLDLGDTVLAGSSIALRGRLQTAGMNARLSIQFSMDGTGWTDLGSNPVMSNAAFADFSFSAPITCRHLRVGITAAPPNAPWELDAVTFLNETALGGVWSGPGTTPGGMFDPSGLVGWQPITYSVVSGAATASHTRAVWVGAVPTGVINGTSPVCPGTSQQLVITGMAPYNRVVNWASSPDGTSWATYPDTGTTYATGALAATEHYRARIFSRGCGAVLTGIFTVAVSDDEPPVFLNCPGTMAMGTDPGQCTAHYTFPVLQSDDDCDPDTEVEYLTLWLAPGSSLWTNVTESTWIELPIGTNLFR
ncbi:MAG: discoidin domain-containing protein, partial [Flavobacteriales bacterium]